MRHCLRGMFNHFDVGLSWSCDIQRDRQTDTEHTDSRWKQNSIH